jgi:hypothetical protein
MMAMAGPGSLEENMRDTLVTKNILPAPQRKVSSKTKDDTGRICPRREAFESLPDEPMYGGLFGHA